jgi:deoxyribodipyrimidine photo-lyase
MVTSLFWFRRDLRLLDNAALAFAAERSDNIAAVFIIEPKRFAIAGPARRPFLLDCLESLNEALEGRLTVAVGNPAELLVDLARQCGASAVVATGEVSPAARSRDRAVLEALREEQIGLHFVDTPYLNPPGRVVSGSGLPYKVFTPYWKAASAFGIAESVPEVATTFLETLGSLNRSVLEALPESVDPRNAAVGAPPPSKLLRGGEARALARLDAFQDRVDRYGDDRNFPGRDVTSRLSADLHFGTLHPRTIAHAIGTSTPGRAAFIRQLYWREFYADIAHFNPHTLWEDLNPNFIETDSGPRAEERFIAWARGETGYPLEEGYQHNRVRMLTASFLVKDLHLPWQWGARWFLHRLTDGDSANNSHGWQWTAGVGTDASPYNRVFNPELQAERFDADGSYVERWLGAQTSQPSMFSSTVEPARPVAPIVDHGAERLEALRRLEVAKSRRA